MKSIVFDIWGDFGHYRKFYTTSSPLTFSVPPRTAISGMIAAIIGLDKEEYLKYFTKDKAYISIKIIKPIKKSRISYNLIDTKSAIDMRLIKNRTQVTYEVLKDCGYRIYFSHKDNEIYLKVLDYLKNHRSYYTPYLGISEYIANFKFVDEVNLQQINNTDFIEIDTVIPFNDDEISIIFDDNKEYFKDTIPNEMNENREVTEYLKIIYERKCKSIKCNISKYYKSDKGDNIVFL